MKTLDLDSGLAARKELANELSYNGETNGSATMNIWLRGDGAPQIRKCRIYEITMVAQLFVTLFIGLVSVAGRAWLAASCLPL